MNTEQERAFIEWRTNHDPRKYPAERDAFMAGWDAGRAVMQSHPIAPAARELALWAYGEVGADPELTPGLAQLLQHFGISDDAPAALQSQDKEDAERYRWLRDSALLFSQIEQRGVSGWMVGRRDHVKARFYTYNGKELDEAIDHARRIEGGKL